MRRTLLQNRELRVILARYAAGERHPRHTDQHSRITLALRGDFSEGARSAEAHVKPGDLLFKSHRAEHEDRFGAHGATCASIIFFGNGFDIDGVDWRLYRGGAELRHGLAALEAALASSQAGVVAAASDLLAACRPPSPERAAPAWLVRLKEALDAVSLAGVDITAEARAAGVHPAHASRLFRRCYGVSITEHAQAQCVRRALARLAGDRPLSDVALTAGFYDQSHMTRVFRRVTGRTPGAHRALLAAAG